jgi:hypothetical protein
MRPKGRRRTRHNAGHPDIDSRVKIGTVQRCNGERYQGQLPLEIRIRVTREDPKCTTEHCTLPDIAYVHPLNCRKGRCKVVASAAEAFQDKGLPTFPIDHPYTIQTISVRVLDLAGRPFLTTGLQVGGGFGLQVAKRWNASRWFGFLLHHLMASEREAFAYGSTSFGPAVKLISRYAQGFSECSPAAADTMTGDGLPACTAVPLSNCDTDPDNAIVAPVPRTGHHNDDGKGKVNAQLKSGGEQLQITGWLRGLEDCDGRDYRGPLQIQAVVRATLGDPSCGSGGCTTINTPLFSTGIVAESGEQGLKGLRFPLAAVGPFPGQAPAVSAEVLRVELLDRSGNSAVVGPSMLVRCNENSTQPNVAGGKAFCFGN